ncbi:formylglycine-generating enzyme family protein [Streptomyces boluensis]|uniref:SUMF1/EgtB/PvdO family nonheme iron enzyme n=1 Tax=Streptomyces boluensis TaxID=1775135 RepID=A0A964V0M6_9ACTN|nr:SUMF1/EgtB/PvdO family nonheme iron enzyme [Streptomyces boluensis]NBE56387.1 SUMF1/EgtB/PvdO family nonheme iron enzyme [Streptomyces boluensis]
MRPATAPQLVELPAGDVTLNDRRTQKSWTRHVTGFRIAAVPVTQEQYAEVTGERPGSAPGDRLPVEGVSWWDALRFCDALSRREGLTPAHRRQPDDPDAVALDLDADGYRLPTEAEWEYACRAGTDGARYGELDAIAWHRGNSEGRLREVGGRQANAWGLHDMLGNVWEWCWDQYDPEVYGTYRVLRGGGWFDEHWSCRASVRRRSHPTLRLDDVGFRVVRSGTTG